MKKEDFVKLGVNEDVASKCESSFSEHIKEYIPKARFDEVNNEKKKLEIEIQGRDSQLEKLKNSTDDVESMKKHIETLQADNETKDETYRAEINQLKVDAAVENAITGANGKNLKVIKALLNLTEAELAEDGKIKGLNEQIEALIKADDSKFLFELGTTTNIKGIVPVESSDSVSGNQVPKNLSEAIQSHFNK